MDRLMDRSCECCILPMPLSQLSLPPVLLPLFRLDLHLDDFSLQSIPYK
jgi:hypothetical protein